MIRHHKLTNDGMIGCSVNFLESSDLRSTKSSVLFLYQSHCTIFVNMHCLSSPASVLTGGHHIMG